MGFSEALSPYLTKGKGESHLKFNDQLGSGLSQMLADAKAAGHGIGIGIYSGYRSPEHQERLFKQALTKYGSEEQARKWVAPPGKSQHNHGNAADLSYATDDARAWAHANAKNYGLHFRMTHEPWHIEPMSSSDGKIAAAQAEIKQDHSHNIDVTQISEDTNKDNANKAGSVETTENQARSNEMSEVTKPEEEKKLVALEDKVIDPTVKSAMDGREEQRIRNMARDFVESLTPQQKMIEMAHYQQAKRYNGESANFEQWFKSNRFGTYLKAYAENDSKTLGSLSPQQQTILSNVKGVASDLSSYSASVMGLV